MAYEACIAQLKDVRPFEGADKLKLATCLGAQVVVGLSNQEDDIVVVFFDDGRLSDSYLKANNLIGYVDPVDNIRKGGFFSENGRVRAQKFRGQKSEAYCASLDSLSYTGYDISKLNIGDKFNTLNGVVICEKYFTPATHKAQIANKEKSTKKINEELRKRFPEHTDTDQVRFAQDWQLLGLTTITSKYHGTSQRSGYVNYPTEIPITNPIKLLWNIFVDEVLHGKRHILNFWTDDENASKLKFKSKVKHEWTHIYGTRRVIRGPINFNSSDYRNLMAAKIAPHIQKGEVWYYEIVGYEDGGAPIMQSVQTKEMGKEFVKRFGSTMVYKYGCLQGTCDIYVYRITSQNEDGYVYEMPWPEIKARCVNAGIKHVPELTNYVSTSAGNTRSIIEHYTEEVDIAETIDSSHIREGVVVRIQDDKTGRTKFWKSKTFAFKCGEGIVKNSDSYIDEEEIQGDI